MDGRSLDDEDEPALEKAVENPIEDDEGLTVESKSGGTGADGPAFPTSRVKRIVKLDPDIKLVSREGIFSIVTATQLFLESLVSESLAQVRKGKRKSVRADDVLAAVQSNSKFENCLGSTLQSLLKPSKKVKDRGEGEEDAVHTRGSKSVSKQPGMCKTKKTTKTRLPPPGSRSIKDFF